MSSLDNFLKKYGSFYGKFKSFKEASRIVSNVNIGYNNSLTARKVYSWSSIINARD